MISGCIDPTPAPTPLPTGPLDVHIVHLYREPAPPETFGVPAEAGVVHFTAKLLNYVRGQCPGPIAELVVRDPGGREYARLRSEDRPSSDCEYVFERNETLAAGYWTIEYVGGSGAIGSVVDVRPVANATSS